MRARHNPHGDGKGIDINLNDFATGFVTSGPLFATITSNIIQSNRGDGIEVIARSNDSGPASASRSDHGIASGTSAPR